MENNTEDPRRVIPVTPQVIPMERRSVPLTPEQVAQMSPAKKALLKAQAEGFPVIIRR